MKLFGNYFGKHFFRQHRRKSDYRIKIALRFFDKPFPYSLNCVPAGFAETFAGRNIVGNILFGKVFEGDGREIRLCFGRAVGNNGNSRIDPVCFSRKKRKHFPCLFFGMGFSEDSAVKGNDGIGTENNFAFFAFYRRGFSF